MVNLMEEGGGGGGNKVKLLRARESGGRGGAWS
jgi:hypothetical protein